MVVELAAGLVEGAGARAPRHEGGQDRLEGRVRARKPEPEAGGLAGVLRLAHRHGPRPDGVDGPSRPDLQRIVVGVEVGVDGGRPGVEPVVRERAAVVPGEERRPARAQDPGQLAGQVGGKLGRGAEVRDRERHGPVFGGNARVEVPDLEFDPLAPVAARARVVDHGRRHVEPPDPLEARLEPLRDLPGRAAEVARERPIRRLLGRGLDPLELPVDVGGDRVRVLAAAVLVVAGRHRLGQGQELGVEPRGRDRLRIEERVAPQLVALDLLGVPDHERDQLRHIVEVEPEHPALDLLAGEHRRLAVRRLEARPLRLLDARDLAHEVRPGREPLEHLGIAEIEAVPDLVEGHERRFRHVRLPSRLRRLRRPP